MLVVKLLWFLSILSICIYSILLIFYCFVLILHVSFSHTNIHYFLYFFVFLHLSCFFSFLKLSIARLMFFLQVFSWGFPLVKSLVFFLSLVFGLKHFVLCIFVFRILFWGVRLRLFCTFFYVILLMLLRRSFLKHCS